MPIVFWNEKLSVNIASIDAEHKKLIEMINDFYENIVNRSNKENFLILINGLIDYTLIHFANEEKYMQELNYDYYKEHKREHDQFISKIKEIEEKINNNERVLSLDMTSFLMDWLKNHILKSDKKYSEFFISKGVK